MYLSTVQIPIEVVLGCITCLGAGIVALFRLIWVFLIKVVNDHSETIKNLQMDVNRLSQGCGVEECTWKNRIVIRPKNNDHVS